MVNYSIILTNKNSDINVKLINFFKKNLFEFNKASITFDFEIVDANNMDKYLKKGIKNFPVIMVKNAPMVGLANIATFLQKQIVLYNKKISNKSDDEKIDDFWKKTIGNIKPDKFGKIDNNDDDDNTDPSVELQKKLQNAFKERSGLDSNQKELIKKRSNTNFSRKESSKEIGKTVLKKNDSPANTLKTMKSRTADDELMAKFFENQEESC